MGNLVVAQTIINQLGGNRFMAMTGAKNLVSLENGVQFSIGGGALKGINKIVIKLNSMDLYDMEFWKVRGTDFSKISEAKGVFFDDMQKIFTEETGFETHL